MKRLTNIRLQTKSFALRALYKGALLAVASLFACHTSKAQFTIVDDLRGSNYPHIKVGGGDIEAQGEAYFTSGIDDPVGSGWLRLTKDWTSQRGFAYIDRSFPSGMGVLIDFEYKMWRSQSDGSYYGADGLSVFLFDATTDFRLGGYGGSLGYAPNTIGGVPEGLAGGYVGVGLDAYGNFSNADEGRNGGEGVQPNAVVLRGPTTNDANTTNEFLDYAPIGNRGGGVGAIRQRNEVDYNITTSTRPTGDEFYRRVQITIMDVENEGGDVRYEITVRWSRTPGGTFEELITYVTEDPPPPTMKVGFAASTGSGFNYHEIRNILVTTLGNLRTVKLADKDFLIPTNANPGADEDQVTYTIEVVNDTNAPIEDIILKDTIKDAYGNVLTGGPGGTFEITDITPIDEPDVWITTPSVQQAATNIIEGTASVFANKTGRIRVTGVLRQTPPGNHVVNTVSLQVPEGTDQDLLNNTSSVHTPVYADGVDLILGNIIPDGTCIDYVNGNTFTVQVSNLGTDDVNVNEEENYITVIVTHPDGITLTPGDHGGWEVVSSDATTHEFLLSDPSEPTLKRGFTHPDAIQFRLTPQPTKIPTLADYTVTAEVSQANDDQHDNDGNNTSTASVQNCAVTSNPMIQQRMKWY